MGRRSSFKDLNRQRSKRKEPNLYDTNSMSDYRFERGDKDGGYNNWIPYQDRNISVDKTNLANKSNMSELIPKQRKKKVYYRG